MSEGKGGERRLTRRSVLKYGGMGAAALATGPFVHVRRAGAADAARELRILQWSHFVPSYDVWFDQFAQEWGEKNGVRVVVDHIALADLVIRANAEVAAQSGHDLFMFIAPPSAFERHVVDMGDVVREVEARHGAILDVAKRSTHNPVTDKWFSFSDGYVPDPGDYLKSVWSGVGMPDGPATWDDLLVGGREIRKKYPHIQMPIGIGLSQELDSNMASRALLWSMDGSVQDANERVVINSDRTVEALEFMRELYRDAMSPAVLSWEAASNNQAFNAGQAAYILNSISAYRTAQENGLPVADDTFFVPPVRGPRGTRWACEHVIQCYSIWEFSRNEDGAKQFLVDLVDAYREAVLASKLYNFPSFPGSVAEPSVAVAEKPEVGQRWVSEQCDNDPFGSNPPDKLAPIKGAPEWSANVGFPGPSNPAVGEVYDTFVLPEMFAKVATGQQTSREAVLDAEARINAIFDKWRAEGLVAG